MAGNDREPIGRKGKPTRPVKQKEAVVVTKMTMITTIMMTMRMKNRCRAKVRAKAKA